VSLSFTLVSLLRQMNQEQITFKGIAGMFLAMPTSVGRTPRGGGGGGPSREYTYRLSDVSVGTVVSAGTDVCVGTDTSLGTDKAWTDAEGKGRARWRSCL